MITTIENHKVLGSSVKLGTSANFLFIISLIFSLLTHNPVLTVLGMMVLYLIVKNTWVIGTPSILLFSILYQWLQAYSRVWQANFAKLDIEVMDHSPSATPAILASLISVLMSSYILKFFLVHAPNIWEKTKRSLFLIKKNRLVYAWIIFFIISSIVRIIRIGALSQLLLPIGQIKWVLFCLILLKTIVCKERWGLFLTIFFIELLLGFTGYFSEFKTVIIYSLIVSVSLVFKLENRYLLFSFLGAFFLLLLSIFWTGVKSDYRRYVSLGNSGQIVNVSKIQSLTYIGSSLMNYKWEDAGKQIDPLLDRLQYTKMLQYAIDYVPANIPHEGGQLWTNAIRHVLIPRIIDPNKPVIDDSKIASKYTGITWAGGGSGTSISLGYFGESYVDFGIIGMLLPIGLLALVVGMMYSFWFRRSSHPSLDFLSPLPMFFEYSRIETSSPKMLGGLFINFIVFVFILKPFIYPLIWKNIKHK